LSGHSKWANIKRQKAVVDAKRGATYARLSREIMVAAKHGPDVNSNFKLRQAVDRAKAEGMPNDNITRAIEKASGANAADSIEELTYEGYGPGGVAILVRCATDNRNRTASTIRVSFSKHSGNLGDTGCVSWIFKERGVVTVKKTKDLNENDLLETALNCGAEDIDDSGEESVLLYCPPINVESVKTNLLSHGFTVVSGDITLLPQSTVEIGDKEIAKQVMRLIDSLENQDDVQQVYANFDMDPNWIQEFLS
jgi:YebC/PmpR family DNA-binding regulatory protein